MPPDLLALINAELARQDAKWGDQRGNGDLFWLAILGEEFGECSKEVADQEYNHRLGTVNWRTTPLDHELIHVLAVAAQWWKARHAG